MARLEGKVAVVTGGSTGIGRATALALAREGAKVAVAARGVEQGEEVAHEIAAAGGEALFIRADMGRPDEIAALVAGAVAYFGRLDCAVNNAATEGRLATLADYEEGDFDASVAVNLKGVWLCMKHEIRQMLAQQPSGGAIVNTSSVNGLGGAALGSLYSATKAGVLALTKSAAQEYGAAAIRVNALAAGGFDTRMLAHSFEMTSEIAGMAPDAIKESFLRMVPLGRVGRPEEAADAIVWLCSDEASYVTGHSMIVDGGVTSWAR
jgi:NAD(P)-dependent dehydrogenase (short-subunit alcohol dehydrogenase family)